jgi:hypothetical protein
LLLLPERSDQVVTDELSAGKVATPLTQSARNHKANPEMPLKAFVLGHGDTAVDIGEVQKLKIKIRAGKIAAKRWSRELNTPIL